MCDINHEDIDNTVTELIKPIPSYTLSDLERYAKQHGTDSEDEIECHYEEQTIREWSVDLLVEESINKKRLSLSLSSSVSIRVLFFV